MNGSQVTNIRRKQRAFFAIPISLIILIPLMAATLAVNAQSTDFAINSTPSILCVNPGVDAVSLVSVQSLGGFSGTVNLGDSIGPNGANAPTLSAIPSSVTLASGQTVSFSLTISTTTSTPNALYTITVSGLSGATIHQATVQLTVAAGCSVGGTVLPTAGLPLMGSFFAYGVAIAGLVGIVGVGLAVYAFRRKTNPTA